MRLTKEQNETESPLLDNRQLRDKCVGRYEVLEQVKTLLLLPDNETATVKQIAEYYSSIRTDEEKTYYYFRRCHSKNLSKEQRRIFQ